MEDSHPGEIVGIGETARSLRQFVRDAAKSPDPVTLVGEPGTGKQLVARSVHEASSRRKAPFLMIDCSLYYERELMRELFGYQSDAPTSGAGKGLFESGAGKGLFEFATRGTCYLARIEELTPGLQVSLLQFLESGNFCRLGDGKEIASGVRLVVSSDKNLKGLVEAGLFDTGLHDKLSKWNFSLPPLRERQEDIPGLVESLVNEFVAETDRTERMAFMPEALKALKAYPWPENFDELRKEIRRLLECGVTCVRSEHLSAEVSSYWLGQHCDPDVRRVLEELDGYIREFKILSRLETELGEVVPLLDDWLPEDTQNERNLLEEF